MTVRLGELIKPLNFTKVNDFSRDKSELQINLSHTTV